jgi:hypothetical protein
MADPTLKKTNVQINYTASDGYRAEFGAKAGAGSKNRATGEEVPPERALLAGLEELSRLLCLFGFDAEARQAFDGARDAVLEWRATRGVQEVPRDHD